MVICRSCLSIGGATDARASASGLPRAARYRSGKSPCECARGRGGGRVANQAHKSAEVAGGGRTITGAHKDRRAQAQTYRVGARRCERDRRGPGAPASGRWSR